jgi:hypothetical protein
MMKFWPRTEEQLPVKGSLDPLLKALGHAAVPVRI